MKNTEKQTKAELLLQVRTARAEREKQARREKAQQRYAKALSKKVFTRNNRTLIADTHQARIRTLITETVTVFNKGGSLNSQLDFLVHELHELIMDIYEVSEHNFTYDYSELHNDRVPTHNYKFTTGFEYTLTFTDILNTYKKFNKEMSLYVLPIEMYATAQVSYIVSSVLNKLDITYDMNKVGV